MGLLELVIVIILVMALLGGGIGWSRREDWGNLPTGGFGLLVLILVIVLLFRVI